MRAAKLVEKWKRKSRTWTGGGCRNSAALVDDESDTINLPVAWRSDS